MNDTFTTNNNSIPWIEKYRPSCLSELILPPDKHNMLREFFKENDFPNLLFYGPPGVGKTSTILSCAQEYYGGDSRLMMMELNASDDRGIDIVRTKIKEFATSVWTLPTTTTAGVTATNGTTTKSNNKPKLIILDEVDGISPLAQSALLVEMESNMSNARFCLICNNINKLNPAIQSRCLRLRFSPLTQDQIYNKLSDIASKEHLCIEPSGIQAIVDLTHGDMRNALNILQQMSLTITPSGASGANGANGVDEQQAAVTEEQVYSCMSIPLPSEIKKLLNYIETHTIKDSFNEVYNYICNYGLDMNSLVYGIQKVLILDNTKRSIDIYKTLGKIEVRMANECSLKIQLGLLLSVLASD